MADKQKKLLQKKDKEIAQLHETQDQTNDNTLLSEVRCNTKAIENLAEQLSKTSNNQAENLEKMKEYSDVVKQNLEVAPPISLKSIRTVVKDVFTKTQTQIDRSRNLIVFGLEGEEEENLVIEVSKLLEEINLKPKIEAAIRFPNIKQGKISPIRVTLESKDSVHEVLKLSKQLISSSVYSNVYISIDRSPEQQESHRELVKKLKKNIEEVPGKHWYIKNNKIIYDEINRYLPRIRSRSSSPEPCDLGPLIKRPNY